MCTVIDFAARKKVKETMTVEEAEALVGEGMMMDELVSTRDLCSDDSQIVEACNVLIANR